ncbi:hypothetical protein AB0L06_01440 [Spirillospora sp. NPDC052269]
MSAAVALHSMYLGFVVYLMKHGQPVYLAFGLAFLLMLGSGVALRLAMPPSAGGWGVTLPLVRIGKAVLRPWLTPASPDEVTAKRSSDAEEE